MEWLQSLQVGDCVIIQDDKQKKQYLGKVKFILGEAIHIEEIPIKPVGNNRWAFNSKTGAHITIVKNSQVFIAGKTDSLQ